jgi:hypothetical protein
MFDKNKKKEKKQRASIITQSRTEEPVNQIRDAVFKSYAINIAKANRYNSGNCLNKGYSYIAYSEHAYIRLNSNILKKWDIVINKGKAIIIKPSRWLVNKLFKEIAARKTIKQQNQAGKSDIQGLIININSKESPAAKELAEILKSSSVNLTGDIN